MKCGLSPGFSLRLTLSILISVALAAPAWAQSPARADGPAKPKIGISKFEVDADLKPSLGKFLYNGLMDQMVKSKQFTVVDWEEIDRVLNYVAKSQPNLSPEEARAQAVHQLGLEKMYLGNLSKVGSKYYITVKVLNLDLTVERTERASAASEDELEKAMGRLADVLLGREKTADKGDGTSQGATAQDAAQNVTQYRKAAEGGDVSAMTYLGWMYANGRGVAQDDAQALAWFRKAADKGDAGAMNNLGSMYAKGRGVAQDDAQAVGWYRKGAEKGNVSAMYNLGWMVENGRGVAQDNSQALSWYRKAAHKGQKDAQEALQRLGANQ